MEKYSTRHHFHESPTRKELEFRFVRRRTWEKEMASGYPPAFSSRPSMGGGGGGGGGGYFHSEGVPNHTSPTTAIPNADIYPAHTMVNYPNYGGMSSHYPTYVAAPFAPVWLPPSTGPAKPPSSHGERQPLLAPAPLHYPAPPPAAAVPPSDRDAANSSGSRAYFTVDFFSSPCSCAHGEMGYQPQDSNWESLYHQCNGA